MTKQARAAVFLDRDGVINVNRDDYVKSWDEFAFLPGTRQALARLSESPYVIVVVTNQSAVHRGLVPEAVLEEIHRRMVKEIRAEGGRIDAVYYCPHTPEEGCDCRKPQPGLFRQAADEWSINLTASYCVGDKLSDVEAATHLGCAGILVRTGTGDAQPLPQGHPYLIASDLGQAVQFIVSSRKH